MSVRDYEQISDPVREACEIAGVGSLVKIFKRCDLSYLNANAVLVRDGDPCRDVFLVIRGSLKLVLNAGEKRKELLVSLLRPGDFAGDLDYYSSSKLDSASVIAGEGAQVLRIPHEVVSQKLQRHPEFALAISRQMSDRFCATLERCNWFRVYTAKERLLLMIRELATRPEAVSHPEGRLVNIRHQDLSAIVGSAREHVTRMLKELEASGEIKKYGNDFLVEHCFIDEQVASKDSVARIAMVVGF